MRHLITAWGVLGPCALLIRAIMRLAPKAWEGFGEGDLGMIHLVVTTVWVAFMAYSEGYRGFQKAFSPRLVARADWLGRNPRWLPALLAPLFTMALFGATRRRMLVNWTILILVVALIVGLRYVAQPWRGIVDAGVVVGLAWGLIAIAVFYLQTLMGKPPDIDLALSDRYGEGVAGTAGGVPVGNGGGVE